MQTELNWDLNVYWDLVQTTFTMVSLFTKGFMALCEHKSAEKNHRSADVNKGEEPQPPARFFLIAVLTLHNVIW